MEASYHPDAAQELIESAKFYERRIPGLGGRFLDAVDEALEFLGKHPEIWSPDPLGRRKQPVRNFPFLLIYTISANTLYILAVAHASRRPGYWKSRDH